jgi:HAD superfamily hydrolase (TIGR01509 family)
LQHYTFIYASNFLEREPPWFQIEDGISVSRRRRALIFDYDGVLADTEPLYWRSWADVLTPYGVQLTWADYCCIGRGVPALQMCQSIQKRGILIGGAEFSQMNLEVKRRVRTCCLANSPIPERTVALLAMLGIYQIGLVTSSARSEVEPVIRACGIYERFDAFVFGEDTIAHKPAPDPYLLIAQKLEVDTGTAFEDSEVGLKSAETAGFNVVAVGEPRDLSQIVKRYLHSSTAC